MIEPSSEKEGGAGGFECLSELSVEYEEELRGWWQNRFSNCLVRHEGQVWLVKANTFEQKRRNLLGGLLGQKIANVAAVKELSARELEELRCSGVNLPVGATTRDTYLVRFGPTYAVEELPRKDLDSAVAAELVFSLWIRRRDAHSYNRSFVKGVPVFYDPGTAFWGEKDLISINRFFRVGPDPGFAGLWRLKIDSAQTVSTATWRRQERARFTAGRGEPVNLLPIHERARFMEELNAARDRIKSLRPEFLRSGVRKAGYRFLEAAAVYGFLRFTQWTIDRDLVRLKSILGLSR